MDEDTITIELNVHEVQFLTLAANGIAMEADLYPEFLVKAAQSVAQKMLDAIIMDGKAPIEILELMDRLRAPNEGDEGDA